MTNEPVHSMFQTKYHSSKMMVKATQVKENTAIIELVES